MVQGFSCPIGEKSRKSNNQRTGGAHAEQFETEGVMIEHLVMGEFEYLKVLRKIEWAEHLD